MVVARDYKFMCSSLGQQMIEEDISEQGLTRVVVAACSPHLHEKTFRGACERAGLNPYLCQMITIREHVSWVHTDKAAATAKAKAVVAGGVRASPSTSRWSRTGQDQPRTLVVGGGIAGIKPRWKWPTPASRSTSSSASRRSAATWPSSTRPSPRWTARPASSRRRCHRGQHPNITLHT